MKNLVNLADRIRFHLADLVIKPRRLAIEPMEPFPITVPLLRGVWGAALHDLSPETYAKVFEGRLDDGRRAPGYVMRPAGTPDDGRAAIDWVPFGPAVKDEPVLLRAWSRAGVLGLGGRRIPFTVREAARLGPTGEPCDESAWPSGWSLGMVRWPLDGMDLDTPIRLAFTSPTRILRRLPGSSRGTLVEEPTLPDVALALVRRAAMCLPSSQTEEVLDLSADVGAYARDVRAVQWKGQRSDLVRHSASQHADVEMFGVIGHLDLPEGPGHLWPLLVAGQWLHVGKSTVVGMGQMMMLPLPS